MKGLVDMTGKIVEDSAQVRGWYWIMVIAKGDSRSVAPVAGG